MKRNKTREQLLIEIDQLKSKVFEQEKDITELKKATQKSKKREKEHNDLINASRDAIYRMTISSGKYSFMSAAAKQVLGYDANEFMNNSIKVSEIIAPNWKDYFKEKWDDLIKGKVPDFYEYQIVDKDGKLRWIHQLNRAVFNNDKKVIAIEGSCRDITKSKQIELALKESEYLYQETQKIGKMGGWSYNVEKDKMTHTDYIYEIYGKRFLSAEDGLQFYHPDDKENVWNSFSDAISKQKPYDLEVRFINAQGDNLFVRTIGQPIIDNGKVVKIIGNLVDITEKKKAEQALKESKTKLKESIAAKDKLYSIISHDLRSPFNSILGYSDLLMNSLNQQNMDETLQYSSIINSSARNTLNLLENLLHWTKSQTGKINFSHEKLILSDIICEIIYISDSNTKSKNISLNFNKSDDFEVFADINMLKTVLRNLISNAIKFTNLNGKIDIYTVQKQHMVEITISDNGIGMNKEKCDTLFKIDTSLTTLGTAGENGSGLGLLLCKEFVKKQGGEIWVESKLGDGSDFKFTLPLKLKN